MDNSGRARNVAITKNCLSRKGSPVSIPGV